MFQAENVIIKKIKSKNKSLMQSLKVVDVVLDNGHVIFRRKDSTSGLWQRIKYKYDSFYELKHVSNWLEAKL